MAIQTDGRRLAIRESLRPQLDLIGRSVGLLVVSRVLVWRAHGVVRCYANRNSPLLFRENAGPSVTKKNTPKNDCFNAVQSVR